MYFDNDAAAATPIVLLLALLPREASGVLVRACMSNVGETKSQPTNDIRINKQLTDVDER